MVQCSIASTGEYRVPVPLAIESSTIIHAATDNFDKNDTKGNSHDTIFMFFQNPSISEGQEKRKLQISSKPRSENRAKISSKQIVATHGGTIPNLSEATDQPVNFTSDHALWLLIKYMVNEFTDNKIEKVMFPSFSAVNSRLNNTNVELTFLAYAPILSYPATDFDS